MEYFKARELLLTAPEFQNLDQQIEESKRMVEKVQGELRKIKARREAREQDERHKPIRDAYDAWRRTAFQGFGVEDDDDKLPGWPEDLQ